MRRVWVILNASAGTLIGVRIEEVAARIRRNFEAADWQVRVEIVEGPQLAERLGAACVDGVDAVVVGGGDGTIATAAHHLVGKPLALGVLPLGTMNLLAKDLGIPLDLDEAATALAHGDIRAIDVCDVNGHVFLNNTVIGMYARMAEERERLRGRPLLRKVTGMTSATLRTLWHFPLLKVRVAAGEHGSRNVITPILVVANNVYEDAQHRLLPRPRLDAGEMGLYVARHRSPWRLVWFMLRVFTGGWQRDPSLESLAVQQEVVVQSFRRRLRISIDGEVMRLRPPLRYRVHPGGLKVLVPASSPAAAREPSEATPAAAAAST